MKETLVACLFSAALLFANDFASSYPAPGSGRGSLRPAQPALDRWQEEHLQHYAALRPLLFEEHAAVTAMCSR